MYWRKLRQILGKYYGLFSQGKFVLLINISDRLYSFLVLLMLAREFSSAEYGEIVTLLTFAMIMQIFFDFGLPAFLQREIAAGSGGSELFSISFVFTLFLFPVYAGISYALKIFIYPQIETNLFLIIFTFIYASSLVNVCSKALSGKNDFKSQFVSFLISRIYILAMFALGLYFVRFSLRQLMLVILTGFLLNFILIFMALGKHSIALNFRLFDFKKIRGIIGAALPLGIAIIFNFMYDKIDVLLISKLKDFDQVAYYNIGYGLYKGASICFSFLLVTGFSHVSSISRNRAAVNEFFSGHARLIFMICLVIAAVLFVLSDLIVSVLYSERYSNASAVIRILAPGFIGLGLNNLTGITLNGMGYFKIVMYITLYGLVLNILLNILFIPLYGIKAASVISVATEYFIFFMQYYYLKKLLRPAKANGA